MKIHLNAEINPHGFTKKDYLLRATQRLGIGDFVDYHPSMGEVDYVLNIQPYMYVRGKKWTGLWHIDVSLNSDIPDTYHMFDTVFVASSVGVRPYDKQIVLFQACDPELHRRRKTDEEYDFVICGSLGKDYVYEERDRVYSILTKHFTRKDFGKGHEPHDYVGKISCAKVQVVQPGLGLNGLGMLAQRFFECLAIGPVLCSYTPDLEIVGNVTEDVDYMCYRNHDELVEKMRTLLNDGELRNTISENGRKKALLYHSYENRLVGILNVVKEYE